MKIKLEHVSKSYEREIIKNISIEIEGYNTLAIIGKSGCGKSTLLRLMTGIEVVDDGSISINNIQLNKDNLRNYQDKISLVFQEHNLFPHLTLLENISVILEKIRKYSSDEAREKSIYQLEKLHLGNEVHKRPRFVSGGQAQRASIARALSTNPNIVFMDEPTASLDPMLTKEVLDSVLELKEAGTKFVFVTHEIDFVAKFADYVIFMDEGKIIEHGDISILDSPQSKKLKEFLL